MHTVKAAVQNTMGHHKHAAAPGASGTSSKYRDGSAHPHAGSDAQVGFVEFNWNAEGLVHLTELFLLVLPYRNRSAKNRRI